METPRPRRTRLPPAQSPTVGDLKVMETYLQQIRVSVDFQSPTVGDLKVMETTNFFKQVLNFY